MTINVHQRSRDTRVSSGETASDDKEEEDEEDEDEDEVVVVAVSATRRRIWRTPDVAWYR